MFRFNLKVFHYIHLSLNVYLNSNVLATFFYILQYEDTIKKQQHLKPFSLHVMTLKYIKCKHSFKGLMKNHSSQFFKTSLLVVHIRTVLFFGPISIFF